MARSCPWAHPVRGSACRAPNGSRAAVASRSRLGLLALVDLGRLPQLAEAIPHVRVQAHGLLSSVAVGREAEVLELRDLVARAAAGSGAVVTLAGEPGVGKSRLSWDASERAREQGFLSIASCCAACRRRPSRR